ncbi:hypothetical protein EYF80_029754 [Liparis tanakae]|uniref:Uncharacterized protein n=1 Tax=Liparis tanakae TaxID=230148 RepID=A0A4Z2H2H4_9TELE|nr:hypothetical protein EYF80_029754 [Liparis tanakae]
MGLPVHHCQPESQPLSVGLGSETDKKNTGTIVRAKNKKKVAFARKLQHAYKEVISGHDDCCGPLPHLFLDVLDEEGGSPQVVNREAEEALDLFLMEVHDWLRIYLPINTEPDWNRPQAQHVRCSVRGMSGTTQSQLTYSVIFLASSVHAVEELAEKTRYPLFETFIFLYSYDGVGIREYATKDL